MLRVHCQDILPRYFVVVATDGIISDDNLVSSNVVTGFLSTKADSIHRVDPMGGQELLYQVKSTNSLWHLDGGICKVSASRGDRGEENLMVSR